MIKKDIDHIIIDVWSKTGEHKRIEVDGRGKDMHFSTFTKAMEKLEYTF